MRIVFFGTSDYCLPVLEALSKNFDLKLVVTRPDKPEGRKKILTPSATKHWAQGKSIEIATPSTLKKDTPDRANLISLISQIRPDLAVVSDYGLIIPEKIFQMPKFGTINVHFSRLPDLRGPSPVQFTLLRGDDEAWVTIFKLENPPELDIKMDSGPIIFQQAYSVQHDDTTAALYSRLFQEAAKVLSRVITDYSQQSSALKAQDHSKATFCRFLTKDDGFLPQFALNSAIAGVRLDFEELPKIQQEALRTKDSESSIQYPAKKILNFFQGVTPWPGMWTFYQDERMKGNSERSKKRMKILQCHLEGEKLVLDLVQFEGKNPMAFKEAKIAR